MGLRVKLPKSLDHQSRSGVMRETSSLAWEKVSAGLSPARSAVLRVLGSSGVSLTATEIGAADVVTGRCPWKRVSELVQMGLVEERPERVCGVTGMVVQTYALSSEPVAKAAVKRVSVGRLLKALDAAMESYDSSFSRKGKPEVSEEAMAELFETWLEYRGRA